MIKLRYKQLSSEKYSAYLDIYSNIDGKKKRNYEYLKIYVTKNYGKTSVIAAIDSKLVQKAEAIRDSKEKEIFGKIKQTDEKQSNVRQNLTDYVIAHYNEGGNSKYKYFHKHLIRFSKGKNIRFDSINEEWIEEFQNHLLQNMIQNSMIYNLGTLRNFLNRAIKDGFITENPFSKVVFPEKTESEKVVLSDTEVELLNNMPISSNSQIKQAFLFSLYTGLRWSDVAEFKNKQIISEKDENGEETKFIEISPIEKCKKKKTFRKPLSEMALSVIENINRERRSKLLFDKLPNKSNCHIKIKLWVAMAGIDKNISFKTARDTYANNLLLSGKTKREICNSLGLIRPAYLGIYNKNINSFQAV